MSKIASTFLYFGYGSNLLAKRIRIRNPTAQRKAIAKLDNYRFDFNRKSGRWGGCTATIVPDPGKYVWGAVWEINSSDMDDLDKQEGVHDNIYSALQVKVTTTDGNVLECRVYQLIEQPETYVPAPLLPIERRPSRIYLEVILQGAQESKLPEDYFQFLKSFPHNGYEGPVTVAGLDITFSITKPNENA